MKLGFVGVGRHAQKMAAAFRECGAEVVAYSRKWDCSVDGDAVVPFCEATRYRDWRAMLSPAIDAIIICAPPNITTEVALACAKAGKRCVATKPLMGASAADIWSQKWLDSDRSSTRPDTRLYVDIWRLYSPAWQALKAELRGKTIQSVHVDFYGNGPVRGFSGALDYGPHALAFALDLLGMPHGHSSETLAGAPNMWSTRWNSGAANAVAVYGSGAAERGMEVRVRVNDAEFVWLESADGHHFYAEGDEGPQHGMRHDRSLALRNFCRAFMSGEPSDTLRLSCEAMKVLMPLAT